MKTKPVGLLQAIKDGPQKFDPELAAKELGPVPQNPWREAILDELATTFINPQTDDPREILRQIIDWHVTAALDPKVSKEAADLATIKPCTDTRCGMNAVQTIMARIRLAIEHGDEHGWYVAKNELLGILGSDYETPR